MDKERINSDTEKFLQDLESLRRSGTFRYNKEIADALGILPGNLSYILSKKKNISREKIIKFYRLFEDQLKQNGNMQSSVQKLGAPYFADIIPNGGLDLISNKDPKAALFYIHIPGIEVDAYINVFGQSMRGVYESGDIVGIKETSPEYVIMGHSYLMEFMNGDVHIKFVKPGSDRMHWSLANANPSYDPTDFLIENIKRVFKIKIKIRKEDIK